MRIIKVGKKRYAIGFWWQVFSISSATYRARLTIARNQAASVQEDHDSVVLRERQYGLGRSENGKIPKVQSLACALIARSEKSWIGLFRVNDEEDLWWVCGATQQLIAGDGDFYGNEAKARHRYNELKSLTEWSQEIVCETASESSTYFQGLLSSGEKVVPLAGESIGRKVAPVLLILLVAFGSWQLWRMYQAHLEAEQAALLAQKAALDQQTSVNPEQIFERKWLTHPLPTVFAAICIDEMDHTPIFSRGWGMASVSCDSSKAFVEWKHLQGASFADLPQGAILNEKDPTQARSNSSVNMDHERPSRALRDKTYALSALSEMTRIGRIHLLGPNWKGQEVRTVERGVGLPPLPVTSPWVKGEWKMDRVPDLIFYSKLFFEAMDKIPGLAITRITRAETNTMEGVIYAIQ